MTMKRVQVMLVATLLLAGAVLAQPAWGESALERNPGDARISGIPSILNSTLYPEGPTFVSAEIAFDEGGSPDPDTLGERGAATVSNHLDNFRRGVLERNDCVPWGPVWVERVTSVDRSTLAAAARTSELVLEGTVVARDFGFYRGMIPGQLLEVATKQVIGGEGRFDSHYVFYPVAEFKAGPYTFCKTDDRYPAPPEVGDGVLLLVGKVFDQREPVLELRDEHSVVILEKGGEARLSEHFEEGRVGRLSRDEVISRVQTAVMGQ